MQPVGGNYFACADAPFDITGLDFEIKDDAVVRVWAGSVEYLADPSKGYLPVVKELQALEGLYDSDDRWALPTRVYARGDRLSAKSANWGFMLDRTDNGDWRPEGDEQSAEWVRFDSVVNGKAQRVVGSGEVSLRRFS